MRRRGIWVEVTTLLIPGLNDDPDELASLAGWIAAEMGPETPWHVSRFFPTYRLTDLDPTPAATVRRAVEAGRAAGLRHVYSGNLADGDEDTRCAQCGETLIRRRGFRGGAGSARRRPMRAVWPLSGGRRAGRVGQAGAAGMSDAHRPAAVAGTFYPAEPQRLGRLVDTLAAAAQMTARPAGLAPESVVGAMVPHAGLVYSGVIAALTWRLAGEIAPATIVLAGTDHQALAAGVGVWTGGPWRTPLGDVPVDRDLALRVVGLGPPFAPDDDAHLQEHSLEVQLPLLLRACPGARIVPLAVSPRLRDHADAGARLGRLLAELSSAGDRILLVASSDMAHYPPARVCEEVDDRRLVPLLELDARHLGRSRGGDASGRHARSGLRAVRHRPGPVHAGRGRRDGRDPRHPTGQGHFRRCRGRPRRTVGYAAAAFESGVDRAPSPDGAM